MAAGQTPYDNLNSYGYTDIIADKLSAAGFLGSYGDYGISGFTTKDVFLQIASDSSVQNSLNNAEIVTLDIGANDILRVLKWARELPSMTLDQMLYTYPGSMDKTYQLMPLLTSPLTNESKVNSILGYEIGAVKIKLGLLIDAIKLFPGTDPKIYVMGYYNALPDYPEFLPLLDLLNKAISDVTSEKVVTYVATQQSMDKHLAKYLPNDIHPTVQGYRAIAKDFWKFIQVDFLRGLN